MDKKIENLETREGGLETVELTEMLVIRHDRNGAQSPLVDKIRLPHECVDRDCSGSAAMEYLENTVAAYCETNAGRGLVQNGRAPTYNDLFNIPAAFLASRHIFVEPVEALLTVEVGMDEEMDIEVPDETDESRGGEDA